jgi:hypothetical protein
MLVDKELHRVVLSSGVAATRVVVVAEWHMAVGVVTRVGGLRVVAIGVVVSACVVATTSLACVDVGCMYSWAKGCN